MADNLTILDSTSTEKTVATSESGGVHTPKHIVSESALPTGAATAAKQPALGTAGTASVDVITVQGVASGTPLNITLDSASDPIIVQGSTGGDPLVIGGTTVAMPGAMPDDDTVTGVTVNESGKMLVHDDSVELIQEVRRLRRSVDWLGMILIDAFSLVDPPENLAGDP